MKSVSRKMDAMCGARFYPEEVRILEKLARRENVTVSEYIRLAVMQDFLLSLNKEAMGYVLKTAAVNMRRNLRGHLKQVGELEAEGSS